MERKNKNIFWEAAILALFIFLSGIILGYFLEKTRTNNIISIFEQSELDLLDVKIQNEILNLEKIDCNLAQEELIKFADRIYEEARLLERYETSNKISDEISQQHKKYDLLRTLLWVNSLQLKERCNNSFHIIVYIYEYKTEDLDKKSLQNVFSKKLSEIKKEFGSSVILIPIAGNLNVNSIEYFKDSYNISSLPAILIDETQIIDNLNELKDINLYL